MIISKTAKICTYGNKKAKKLWVVLHGYGQLANYFIRKFHGLDSRENFVIAPEGLHRFYLKGSAGRVGASWMTKEERMADILDYVKYLNQLKEEYRFQDYDRVILLGFSQGAATSARWMELGAFEPNIYIHWAGVFPPDLEFNPESNTFIKSKNYYVVGTKDQFFNQDKVETERAFFKSNNIDMEYLSFEGMHDIDSSILEEIEGNIVLNS